MPLVLNQKLHGSEYRDTVGELYHYPLTHYRAFMRSGEIFVYYHPWEAEDRERYYFGVGRTDDIYEDPEQPDRAYAVILDYTPFDNPVGLKEGGEYLEARSGKGTQFFRSVRPLEPEALMRILRQSRSESVLVREAEDLASEEDSDYEILQRFNRRYEKISPAAHRRMTLQIDRPTRVSRALKSLLGSRCQICSREGFRTASGELYAEAHHLEPLHRKSPGSLVTDNILIVCPNCHAMLHHADVRVELPNPQEIHIHINDVIYRVTRNLLDTVRASANLDR